MKSLNHSKIQAVRPFVAALLAASVINALADMHYVDVNSTNAMPPYTNWATAAADIQDAVDATVEGERACWKEYFARHARKSLGIEPFLDRRIPLDIDAGTGKPTTVAHSRCAGRNTVTNPIAGRQQVYRLIRDQGNLSTYEMRRQMQQSARLP